MSSYYEEDQNDLESVEDDDFANQDDDKFVNPEDDNFVNQEDDESSEDSSKCSLGNVIRRVISFIFVVLAFIFVITFIVFVYLVFANFIHYAFYPLIFGWVSISSERNPVFVFLSVIYMLSDFYIFFSLIAIVIVLVMHTVDIGKFFLEKMFGAITVSCLYGYRDTFEDYEMAWVLPAITCFSGVIIGGYFYNYILDFIITLVTGITIAIFNIYPSLRLVKILKNAYKTPSSYRNEEELEREKEEKEEKVDDLLFKIFSIPEEYSQMLTSDLNGWPDYIPFIIFSLLVLIGQFYIIIISCMGFKDVSTIGKIGIVFGVIFRILSLPRALDVNIYHSLLYYCKVVRVNLEHYEIDKKPFFLTLIMYVVAIGAIIAIFAYVGYKDLPNIEILNYIENRNEWNRELQTVSMPSFCSVPKTEPQLSIDDLAVLTTLPRLYQVIDGKCYIKPKLRGVFNSTMKYIFGENYKDDKITIGCFPYASDPYLILTSDKLFEEHLNKLATDPIQINDKQFASESTDYFSNRELCADGLAKKECETLKRAIDNKDPNVNKLWEAYTNHYWQEYKGSAVDTPGLEQYQYTIDRGTILQPRAILSNGEYTNGLHFVIGGGFENEWGYSYHIENFIRKYLPVGFESLIPLYSTVTNLFSDVYNFISEYIYGFIYVKTLSYKEMKEISNLMSSFNFSHNNVLMIGHSISATTMKEFSYVSDFNGITFEASKGQNYAKYRVSENYTIENENTQNIFNYYSGGIAPVSGIDSDFRVNNELPELFYNPNVFDDACLIAATCSRTEKYVPFCNQVLNQGGNDPVKMFNKILDAYKKVYYK